MSSKKQEKRSVTADLYIECYKCFNDQRYYVPSFVISKQPELVFKINFGRYWCIDYNT